MIDATYAELRRYGGVGRRPLAAGTLARVHVVLRAALSQAVRWGWIWDNPVERAHRLVTVTRELRPPTPQELRSLLDHVGTRDPQLHTLLVLAAFTGARRAQLLGLRWHNVHLAVKRVSFSAGWVEGPDGPVLTATKTKRRHVVDLDRCTVDVLVDRAANRGCHARPGAFVFSDDGGTTAWKPNRVTKAFLRHRRDAGLRPFRLHDLRHFMATEMFHAGVPLVIVSRRLDHRRVSTTLDSTPTPYPAATPKRPPPSGKSCNQPVDPDSRVVEAGGVQIRRSGLVARVHPRCQASPDPSIGAGVGVSTHSSSRRPPSLGIRRYSLGTSQSLSSSRQHAPPKAPRAPPETGR
jgi:integrase